MKTHGPFASQMLIELHGCNPELLNSPAALKDLLLEAVRRAIVEKQDETAVPTVAYELMPLVKKHVDSSIRRIVPRWISVAIRRGN